MTASAQQADSIKFSPAETKALLRCWENYPKLEAYADSCDRQEHLFRERLRNDSIEKVSAEVLINTQQSLIDASGKLTAFYQGEARWKNFWKWLASALAVIGTGEAFYIAGRLSHE